MKKHQGKYTTLRDKMERGILILSLAAAAAMIWLNVSTDLKSREHEIIGYYPMTNQHITWDGAGYNGIYGR